MALFNYYPWTDFHELNLDWIVKVVKEYVEKTDNYVIKVDEFIEYVNNYFANLNVQDEIDNKLEDMAASGELVNIIAEYLNMASIIAYDTKAALKASDSLTTDMTVLTLGTTTWNDGYTVLYKIKDKDEYIPDDQNILALTNYPDKVAIKITGHAPELDTIAVFGDSWSAPDVADAVWPTNVASYLNCNLKNYAVNGAFLTTSLSSNNVNSQITTAINDTETNPNKVKYVILLGGINDYRNSTQDEDALSTTISNLLTRIKSTYPNALIYYISNCQYPYTKAQAAYWSNVHRRLTTKINVNSLNMFGLFGHTLFNSNYFHLTNAGQRYMASQIIKELTGGKPSIFSDTIILRDTTKTVTAIVSPVINDNIITYNIRIRQIPANITNLTFNFDQLSYSMPYTDTDNSINGGLTRNYTPFIIQKNNTAIIIALQSALAETTSINFTLTEEIYG